MTPRQILLLIPAMFFSAVVFPQEILTPAEKLNFEQVSSYTDLSAYIRQIDAQSDLVSIEKTGSSVKGREINALLFSTSGFGRDAGKIRVLIFAQQHGNEQSGKEGALLLARELIRPENRYLFDRIDFALIPQINPDGSEVNKRRNANDADLNRNHLILTEPETMALHNFFDKYRFEVTMDVHEYSPYGDDWVTAGFRKNSEVTLGTTTNLNVPEKIRMFSQNKALPFLFNFLGNRNFSCFTYCPGDPPGNGYIRHSTFDINDGRQSFGIQSTLSFIQEGMNGKDDYTDNLKKRAQGQMTGMRGLLEFVFLNKKEVIKITGRERQLLMSGKANPVISVQSEHIGNGQVLNLPVYSYKTGMDSMVKATDYRPVVSSLKDVVRPAGYLVPVKLYEIMEWAGRHNFEMREYLPGRADVIQEYTILKTDSIDFEGDIVLNPFVEIREYPAVQLAGKYVFIPTAQIKGTLIVLGLEPASMLGLVTYKRYRHLLKIGEVYPILRIK
ncbi:MAG: hypothetical protein IPN08_11155 [Bacteroidales bacterium]|nr:hypothetical protein [Bacteroidales bacterium]